MRERMGFVRQPLFLLVLLTAGTFAPPFAWAPPPFGLPERDGNVSIPVSYFRFTHAHGGEEQLAKGRVLLMTDAMAGYFYLADGRLVQLPNALVTNLVRIYKDGDVPRGYVEGEQLRIERPFLADLRVSVKEDLQGKLQATVEVRTEVAAIGVKDGKARPESGLLRYIDYNRTPPGNDPTRHIGFPLYPDELMSRAPDMAAALLRAAREGELRGDAIVDRVSDLFRAFDPTSLGEVPRFVNRLPPMGRQRNVSPPDRASQRRTQRAPKPNETHPEPDRSPAEERVRVVEKLGRLLDKSKASPERRAARERVEAILRLLSIEYTKKDGSAALARMTDEQVYEKGLEIAANGFVGEQIAELLDAPPVERAGKVWGVIKALEYSIGVLDKEIFPDLDKVIVDALREAPDLGVPLPAPDRRLSGVELLRLLGEIRRQDMGKRDAEFRKTYEEVTGQPYQPKKPAPAPASFQSSDTLVARLGSDERVAVRVMGPDESRPGRYRAVLESDIRELEEGKSASAFEFSIPVARLSKVSESDFEKAVARPTSFKGIQRLLSWTHSFFQPKGGTRSVREQLSDAPPARPNCDYRRLRGGI